MTEVIVRELRLRGYQDVQRLVATPRGRPGAGVADDVLAVREPSPSDTLVRRYSRRRDHDVALDL